MTIKFPHLFFLFAVLLSGVALLLFDRPQGDAVVPGEQAALSLFQRRQSACTLEIVGIIPKRAIVSPERCNEIAELLEMSSQ